jgi:hypothetical protein
MTTSNKETLQKVDNFIGDLDGGLLVGEQAREFIQMAIANTTIQQFCRTVTLPEGKKTIPRMGFGTRILRRAVEGQALTEIQRAKVTFDSMTLDTKPFVAEVRLSYDAIAKNVEKMGIEASIQTAMAARIGLDVDDLVMNADTLSLDPFYNGFDGMRKLAGHTIGAGGAAFGKDVMRDMFKALPAAFKRDKKLMAFFASQSSAENYGDELGSRATALGDKYLEGSNPMFYQGARVLDSSVIPEDLGIAPNYRTDAILTDPRNAVIGWMENITFETVKDISARVWVIVATVWIAFGYEQPDGVVLVDDVGL